MYVYIIRVYRMYMYLYIIYSYIRVPRVVARVCMCVCHTYVINRRVCPPAQSGLCVLTCCLWKGEKTRKSVESDERKHRGEERPEKGSVVVELLSNCRHRRRHSDFSDFRKKMRIEREARRARCSGTASLRT